MQCLQLHNLISMHILQCELFIEHSLFDLFSLSVNEPGILFLKLLDDLKVPVTRQFSLLLLDLAQVDLQFQLVSAA